MKFLFMATTFCIALNISCAKNDGPAALQPAVAPSPVKNSEADEKPVSLNCTTINFLQGGIESAGGSKTLLLSKNDDNKVDIISTNSLNEISIRSNHGQVYMTVRDVQFNYIRGEAKFPLTTSSVTLYPNNSLFNHGYSFVNCSTEVKAQAKDEDAATWVCKVDGYKDDKGNLVSFSKTVEISGADNNKDFPLFENKEIKLTLNSHHSEFLISSESKSNKNTDENKSWARTDGFNNQSLTFFDPHYLATGYSELDLENSNALSTVNCSRDLNSKK